MIVRKHKIRKLEENLNDLKESEILSNNKETAIAVVEDNKPMRDSDILSMDFSFDEKIEVASKVATSLSNVIKSQGLSVDLNGKEYVTVDGWETLGVMLGCTPFVEEVVEIPSDKKAWFGYKATVSIRQGDTVISRASAMAERNNKQRDRPSVYSMSQTRALGKAFRMALGWIVKMGGYESTPYEEMPTPKRYKPKERVIDIEGKVKEVGD